MGDSRRSEVSEMNLSDECLAWDLENTRGVPRRRESECTSNRQCRERAARAGCEIQEPAGPVCSLDGTQEERSSNRCFACAMEEGIAGVGSPCTSYNECGSSEPELDWACVVNDYSEDAGTCQVCKTREQDVELDVERMWESLEPHLAIPIDRCSLVSKDTKELAIQAFLNVGADLPDLCTSASIPGHHRRGACEWNDSGGVCRRSRSSFGAK